MGNQVPLDNLRNRRFYSVWCAKNAKEARELFQRDYVIRSNIEEFCKEKKADYIKTTIKGTGKCEVDLTVLRGGSLRNKESTAKLSKLIEKSSKWHEIKPIIEQQISISGVQKQELDAKCISFRIASEMEKGRSPSAILKSMKNHAQEAIRFGALGVQIKSSGRIGGVEMTRVMEVKLGKVPRKSYNANTFYAFSVACTKSGTCGVKVRVNLSKDFNEKDVPMKHFREENRDRAAKPRGNWVRKEGKSVSK